MGAKFVTTEQILYAQPQHSEHEKVNGYTKKFVDQC